MPTIKVMSWNIQNLGKSKQGAPGAGMYLDPANAGQFVSEYIASVVNINQVKILAILEVLGESGNQTAEFIRTALGDNWRYVISSVQRHNSRQERCIVLWDQNAGSGVLGLKDDAKDNPSACWTYSHVDDNSLERFFGQVGWANDRDKQIKCYSGLVRGGYLVDLVLAVDDTTEVERHRDLTSQLKDIYMYEPPPAQDDVDDKNTRQSIGPRKRFKSNAKQSRFAYKPGDIITTPLPQYSFSYRVAADKWAELEKDIAVIVLLDENDEPILDLLTPDQLIILKNILVQTDIIYFGESNERNPFLVNFNLGDNPDQPVPFLLAAYHASNPDRKIEVFGSTKMKFSAINSLAECIPFQNDCTMLLAGDFNVTAPESVKPCDAVSFDKVVFETKYGYWPIGSINLANPFENITGGDVNATALVMGVGDDAKTSISSIDTALKKYQPGVLNDFDYSYKNEAYDKFFFKRLNNQIEARNTGVTDLILAMNNQKRNQPGSVYNDNIAMAGMRFFKSRWNDLFVIAKTNVIGGPIYAKNLAEYVPQPLLATTNTVNAKRNEIATFKNELEKQKRALLNKINAMENVLNLMTTFNNPADTVPENQFTAFLVYSSFSDHLPIITEIGPPVPPPTV